MTIAPLLGFIKPPVDRSKGHTDTKTRGQAVRDVLECSASLLFLFDSSRIFYRGNRHIMAVPMDASGAEPAFGKPTALFADQ